TGGFTGEAGRSLAEKLRGDFEVHLLDLRLRPSHFQSVLQPEGLADEKARSGTGREVKKYHILLTERAGTPCVLDRVRRVSSCILTRRIEVDTEKRQV
ncbi:hypothetical protein ACW7EJ_00710, partial [Acinetobacter soli]